MTARPTPLQAVILDWAGTTVDYGSRAPTQVFLEIFRRSGIEITIAEARGPMGSAKRDHIASILGLPRIRALWRERHGQEPQDVDVQALYDRFLPLQKETLAAAGANVIEGIPEAIEWLRRQGLKIGSTTGYTRELMDVVASLAARGGYAPDVIVCSDEVRAGRPAPWLNFRAAELLGVYPLSRVIVVDDTPLGIAAGRSAGAITVGVSQTGNSLGFSAEEVSRLPYAELQHRLAAIQLDLQSAGAHLVIRSVAELPQHWPQLQELVSSVAGCH